jgi:hypothetical protein
MSATTALEDSEKGPAGMQNDAPQNTDTYIHANASSSLAPAHQQYLMERHGTLDLDPVPGPGGADPYNWPHWKVYTG